MDATFDLSNDWDRLLASSTVDTVFLSSAWLRAWRETIGADSRLLIPQIRKDGELIAAAAFQHRDGVIEFAAAGPSDYSGFVVSAHIDPQATRALIWQLIRVAADSIDGFRCFQLSGVVMDDSITSVAMKEPDRGFFVSEIGRILAPAMDLSRVGTQLTKKSRQRERTLRHAGSLTIETYSRAEETLPQLDEFFDQHVRRWSSREPRSLFVDDHNRAFYRSLTHNLASSGSLRFTAMRLDGRLIAAHFGFCYSGRFLYYKPTFEPELSKLSPGIVLLEQLLQAAAADGAREFDFLIGDEPYKYRFATNSRTVVDLHITKSVATAALLRIKRSAKWIRDALGVTPRRARGSAQGNER